MMEYDIHTLLDALTLAATGTRAGLLLCVAGRCCGCCCVLLAQAAGRALHAGSHYGLLAVTLPPGRLSSWLGVIFSKHGPLQEQAHQAQLAC